MQALLSTSLLWLAKIIASQEAPQEVTDECWKDVTPLAVRHGLAPMLLHAAKAAQVDTTGDHWQAVIAKARHVAMQYTLLDMARGQIEAQLAAQGIEFVWLKGIVLARTVYPHPTLRPMGDLDVLVRYGDREAAQRAVEALGYTPTPAKAALTAVHHDAYLGGPAGSVIVEVHFRLLGNAAVLLPLDALDWFWAHTADRTLTERALLPEAHLLFLCAHAELQHDRASLHLLRYFDLHLLITHSEMDWAVVIDQAVALRWSFAVESALRLCVDAFGAAIPDSVFEALQSKRLADEDTSHVTRRRASGAWERTRGHLSVLSPTERIGAMLRLIVPSRDYMQARYGESGWRVYMRRWWVWVIKALSRTTHR